MKASALEKLFEEKILKGTCFDTLVELQKDKTLVDINVVRAMIAVNLEGVWRGMCFMNNLK